MNNRQACSDCSLRGQPMSEYTGSAHPDILFVGEYPILQHAGNSVPVAKEKLVTRIINNEQTEHIRYGHICAVRCVPDKAVCNRKNIDICAQQLKDFIYQSKPRVIVALGTIAVKGLGISNPLRRIRGSLCEYTQKGLAPVTVIPTYSPSEVLKKPGLYYVLENDIKKAFDICRGTMNQVTPSIFTPVSSDEIVRRLTDILTLSQNTMQQSGTKLLLAVDTETTSLTPYNSSDRVILVSLAWDDEQCMAFPWEHRATPFTKAEFNAVKDAFTRLVSADTVEIVMANSKFDMQWLKYRYGLNINPCNYDVILAEHLLNMGKQGEYSLKTITRDRIPLLGNYEDDVLAFKASNYEDIPIEVLMSYAAQDALVTRLIVKSQQTDFSREDAYTAKVPAKVQPLTNTLKHITMPLSHVLAHMEYNGITVDRELITNYRHIVAQKMDEYADKIHSQLGTDFSITNPANLRKILYEEKHLPVINVTEKHLPSVDSDTLRELADTHQIPFLKDLLAYRELSKCLSTYLNPWLEMSALDGKLHCSFLQHGTSTGRLSSCDPNLQNVPFALKEAHLNLKSVFLPDSDDFLLYDLDISNAEMRVLCGYSKDETLTAAFNEEKDLHCLTGSAISDYSYEDLLEHKDDKTSDQYMQRQMAKRVNFGTVYGIGAEGLQKQLWSQMRISKDLPTCRRYLDGFFTMYPGVKRYLEKVGSFAKCYGFTWTYTGRRHRFPFATYKAARQVKNANIQSTSSDLVTQNLVDIQNWILPLGGRVLLTVHDSIVFQLPKDITGVKSRLDQIIIGNTATRAPWLPVQWKFDVGCGSNYGATKHLVC